MKTVIIATSLDPDSKSQLLARKFHALLEGRGLASELFDLRTMALPFSGTEESWSSPEARKIKAAVAESTHVVFAVPIYCYAVNAAAKNVIEIVGKAFSKKVVSFLCSAGGAASHMAVMSFANQLMLDFRSVVVPRFLYVDPSAWEGGTLSAKIEERMQLLLCDMQEIQVQPAPG